MTVAVTGAAGHVGANLVRALLSEGRSVRALVRDDTRGVDGLDVVTIRTDVLDPSALREAFDGVDVVYHLAAKKYILITLTSSHYCRGSGRKRSANECRGAAKCGSGVPRRPGETPCAFQFDPRPVVIPHK